MDKAASRIRLPKLRAERTKKSLAQNSLVLRGFCYVACIQRVIAMAKL